MTEDNDPYKKAYYRLKSQKKELEIVLNKDIELLKSENTSLKSENIFLKESYNLDLNDSFIDQYPNPIFLIDFNLKIIYSNILANEILISNNLDLNLFSFLDQQDLLKIRSKKKIEKPLILKGQTFQLLCYKKEESIQVFFKNLTKETKLEFDFEKLSNSFDDILNSVNDIIYKTNGNGEFTFANAKGIEITGYPLSELRNITFHKLLKKSEIERVKNHYYKVIKSKIKFDYFEFEFISKTGKSFWLGQNVTFKYIGKKVIETIAIARDITEIKYAKIELENSEEKYRKTIENLKFGIMEVDLNENITKVYSGMEIMTGYNKNELINKKAFDVLLTKE